MEDKKVEVIVTLLTIDNFLEKYPRFTSFAKSDGRVLFNAIMQEKVFINTSVIANYGYPSVLGVANQCEVIISKSEILKADSFTKQFIGSVVCALMEANGYKKTGNKKSVPHNLFSTGEVYEKNQTISRVDSLKMCGSERLANLKTVDKSVTIS